MSDRSVNHYSTCINGHEYISSVSEPYGGGTKYHICHKCKYEQEEEKKIGNLTINEFKKLFKEIIKEIQGENNE